MSNHAAFDLLYKELLNPDGDLHRVPIAPNAVFVGPMVEHLDREELIHFVHDNFVHRRREPVEILERCDGERFSTVSFDSSQDDRPDIAHFIAEAADGEIVALRMAFNVHAWPSEYVERLREAAVEWRAAHGEQGAE
jgi:hypothetical protein